MCRSVARFGAKVLAFSAGVKGSDELIAGLLRAARGFLTGSSTVAIQHPTFLPNLYTKLYNIFVQSDTVHRYAGVISALEVVKDHAALFSSSDAGQENCLLKTDPGNLYNSLLKLCLHKNKDVRNPALDATDAWLAQVAVVLQPNSQTLQTLWKTCQDKMGEDDVFSKCLALRGFGVLAQAVQRADSQKLMSMWVKLTMQVKLVLEEISTDSEELDPHQLLPDLLISLADFLLQMTGDVSDEDLQMLADTCAVLLDKYQTAMNARRFLFERAFYFLLYALHQRSRALPRFLDLLLYRSIITSVTPELGDKFARPGVSEGGAYLKQQPCFRYSKFWVR